MSDRRLRAPPANAATATAAAPPAASTTLPLVKRARKPSLKNTDDDKQRERKRALDRKAQRASREKTRSHIAHLEKMVQILSDQNGSKKMSEMMDEMNRLHAEIDRLRKIIDSIKSVLGADIFESTGQAAPQRRISQSPDEEPSQAPKSPTPSINQLCEVNSPSEASPVLQAPTNSNHIAENNWDDDLDDALGVINSEDASGQTHTTDLSPKSSTGFSWGNGHEESSIAMNRWNNISQDKHKDFEHTPFWNLPCPLKTGMSEPAVPDFIPCKIWQKANAIYAGIFDYPRERILSANKADAGSLFKVVKEGWGSLSLKERANPVLQILKEVDQCLFWDLDPVTKIANLYKSMLLLKYYFNASAENLSRMPLWQRPVPSQKTHRHPIPIDFFPWPALRDRLVRHHNYYFATSEFSVQYREHFKFSWPFAFEDTYRVVSSAEGNEYTMSPLFERYHRDMRCWSMEPVFFQKFPELLGEISVLGEELEMGTDGNGGPGFGEEEWRGTDECVMELFNDYPPT